ncbi:YcbX family protein [Erwinia amylovora]|uniref:YcbX family protein n=1 Tax=Erwinia amylovora TaxID=552 RepID=UPI00144466E9|nr:YcbX family protein [Erwinia amylovora]
MVSLTRLFVHPVKSMRGMQVSHARALASGLAFDRICMLTEADGTFLTARQHPEMVLFTPAMNVDGLHLSAPDGSSATVRFADFQPTPAATRVWGSAFTALIAPDSINQWLSGFFPRPVQLRWVGPEMTRRVKRFTQVPLGFADGYPYLLINEASLRDVQQRCPAGIKIEQFRPNLVVSGATAWAEDSWASLKIGNVIFDVAKPCSRCILTTVSTRHGRRHPGGEPLNTLQGFRSALDGSGDIDFGLNLLARNSGVLRVGDRCEVLATRAARAYGGGPIDEALDVASDAPGEVSINWQGQHFTGNNQQVLLEQLEMRGIRVPYSCRAGICGSCAITLVSGEVKPMKKDALRKDGTLLSCSCIPASDLVLR